MKNSEAKSAAARLMEMQIATSSKRESLARLNHDPEYVERIIRQKIELRQNRRNRFQIRIRSTVENRIRGYEPLVFAGFEK